MDSIQHDPRSKQHIKEALYQFLYSPAQKRYEAQLHQIIIKNTVALKASHASFMYKGVLYSHDVNPPPRKMNRLVAALVPAMDDYLKDIDALNSYEMPHVIGFITQVLNSSNDFQDYLKIFPDVLHPPLQAIIATCPCRTRKLSDKEAEKIQAKNNKQINLIKQRLITNLII